MRQSQNSGLCQYSFGSACWLLYWASVNILVSLHPFSFLWKHYFCYGSWLMRNLTPHPLKGIHFSYYGGVSGLGLVNGKMGWGLQTFMLQVWYYLLFNTQISLKQIKSHTVNSKIMNIQVILKIKITSLPLNIKWLILL